MARSNRPLLRTLATLCLLLPALWAVAALSIDAAWAPWPGLACALLMTGLLAWLRPFRYALAGCGLIVIGVIAWWLHLAPGSERDWQADVTRPPRATLDGHMLTIENVRNFRYHGADDTDSEQHWETRRYDLSKIIGLDIYLSSWGPQHIAHTIMSWRFADGPPLAISIETRKERGESYSAVLGFFRQYELYYVVADERDVIGVRTGHRGETIRLYAIAGRRDGARRLLMGYIKDINALAAQPRWYNAFTTNCTTVIFDNVQHVFGVSKLWDWRVYANAHLPEMLYEEGFVDTTMPYAELQQRSDITAAAQAADGADDFSTRIRANLPVATMR
ncbi:MAG: DUF4105 domain-containing protein [Moraxellaceae bacterium]|nr:DUF4105 domain-containing protein [Moraxellaceae bacterium]